MQTVTLSGLHCEACVKMSIKKLLKIADVSSVVEGDVFGEFKVESSKPVSSEEIKQALAGTDYSLTNIR